MSFVTAPWRKSTYSGEQGACVEVSQQPEAALIRDTKLGEASPIIAVPAAHWPEVLELTRNRESGKIADALTITVDGDGGATIDSYDTTLVYNAVEWAAFERGVRDGEFDRT